MKKKRNKTILISLLLFVLTLALFLYTVKLRRPWFGHLSLGHHQWLSGHSILFSKIWYREGPLKVKLGMIMNPASVEFPTLASRGPYPSYPPGAILPIYLLAKLLAEEPNPVILMTYNLFNHFLIAFFLSLTIFFFLRRLKFSYLNSFLLALVPVPLELLLPAPLYWQQNVFFADQAVILPFTIFVFLEVIRDYFKKGERRRKILDYLQAAVFFFGLLTDWLFVFLSLAVYLKRIFLGEIKLKRWRTFLKQSFLYFLPGISVLLLFVLQLYSLGVLKEIVFRFLFRTGLGEGGKEYIGNFFHTFWQGYISKGFGRFAVGFLWLSLFVFVVFFLYFALRHFQGKRIGLKIKESFALMGIFLIPPFVIIYFLKNHSAIHDFTALKFSLPLSTVPFVLLPAFIFLFLKKEEKSFAAGLEKPIFRKVNLLTVFALIFLLSASLYAWRQRGRFRSFFPRPSAGMEINGKFIDENTEYKDIVFSPNFVIPRTPPQRLAFSMKRIYKVDSVEGLREKLEELKIKGDYQVALYFNLNQGDISQYPQFEKLTSIAFSSVKENNYCLYKIKKERFFKALPQLKNSSQ